MMMRFKFNTFLICLVCGCLPATLLAKLTSHGVAANIAIQLTIKLQDKKTGEPLPGAVVYIPELKLGGQTDNQGVVALSIPDVSTSNGPNHKASTFEMRFTAIGYKKKQMEYTMPTSNTQGSHPSILISLDAQELGLEEVTVASTRTNNRVEEIPTRVEVLGTEEINEEIAMNPGNISKLLGESSGIQSRQSNPNAGNVSFRILGLPGQYTQLLQDGLPIYGGIGAGLSLVQIPPLDLTQVEIIKGANSALYGGEAIAGLVNLISKKPTDSTQLTLLLNQTLKQGNDISAYYSAKKGKMGFTLLTSTSSQQPMDINGDGFTDLPALQQYTIKPKFFYNPDNKTSITLGLSSFYENRQAGDMIAITKGADSLHPFIEKQTTSRNNAQLLIEKKINPSDLLSLKSVVNVTDRSINIPDYTFQASQTTSYSEITYLLGHNHHKEVMGVSFISDQLNTKLLASSPLNYQNSTLGLFLQDDWQFIKKLTIQSGLRWDYHNHYGSFLLPRLSLLYKPNPHFYIRAGGGMGYRIPSVFTDEAEAMYFRNVNPPVNLQPERSQGLNADFNFKHPIGDEISLILNQSFYISQINNALIPDPAYEKVGILVYQNTNPGIYVKSMESTLKCKMDETELAIGYTYADAILQNEKANSAPLAYTPKNRLVMSLVVGEENEWRVGLEEFYTGRQYVYDGTLGHEYWTTGAIIEKTWGKLTCYGNVENIFDVRQSRWEPTVTGTFKTPVFRPLYAPIDGLLINVALKFSM